MQLLSLLFSPIKEFWKKGDVILLGLCLAASTFGLALIYSATRYQNTNRPVIIQAIAIGLGVVAYLLLPAVHRKAVEADVGRQHPSSFDAPHPLGD